MERPRIFASIMYVRSDYSSGVYKQSSEYDSSISVEEYSDLFLNQIRMRYNVIKAAVFSIELAQQDKNGNHLFDEHGHIGTSFKETSDCDLRTAC